MPASSAGQVGESQPVLQDRDARHAEERAPDCAAATGDRRAAEYDGRDGHQLVPGAGVGFRLADARDIQKRRAAGDQPGEDVYHGEPASDRDARVPRAFR